MHSDPFADIAWNDNGVPVSRQFDDPYFSLENGLDETRHVFLAGNGLPGRFTADFHIAELGFGSGLNLLAAWQAWQQAGRPGTLRFTSFEAFPMAADDMARVLENFPQIADLAAPLLANWRSGRRWLRAPGLLAEVIVGDARAALPQWRGLADAWFLDGFAPAKNPELWGDALMAEVGAHTRPGGTFATYSAAGHIRRALEAAGFAVDRVPGYGRKRHMSVGVHR
ncbi:FAD-dependent oxidoreductase [Actibacterium mucosum KCTC 23349]|uniref:FAD-dependent oxidoreductase n=1 Tax=Actibacterium mucosum KCTC 23349 TaxID=1454373 RepID=A0A037ZMV6_9RHOB|nr:tRNA (5-methylaminomethyl-2-thiouridine)(34)-methyltransferase MnmD [Actibacterium mucosum]KAJ56955.1 FAD-dependent oxidoreductase [Actibacterium mucosum KCTC 23349]